MKSLHSRLRACTGPDRVCVSLLASVLCFYAPLSLAQAAISAAAPAGISSPLDPEVAKYLQGADDAAKRGNANLALIELKNAVRLAPKNGEVRARLGVMLLSFGQTVAAERELRQARNDGAPEEIALPPLLQAMLIRKETKELLAEFPDPPQGTQDKAAPDILKARALAFQVLGQTKDANAAIDRALGLRRDLQMLVIRATLAREQNDLALALRLADEVSLLAPASQEAAVLKISLFHQSGQLEKVLATADEFVRRNPQSLAGKLMRAEALIELHQDAKANEEIEAALKQAPNSLLGKYYLAILRARAQDFKGAWAIAQSLSPDFVQSEPDFAMMVSYIAQANGQLESAGGILTVLISRHPEVIRARLQLAGVRLSQQDPAAALAILEPLKTLDDAYTQALLAHTYLLLHRYNEAITFLEKTLSSGRDDRLLKGELAVSQLEVGNMDEAAKGFRELVERNPGNPELAAPLIGVLMRTGKLDEALKIADGMAKAKPQSALPAFFRGEILAAKGNLAGAVTAFDQSLAADPKYIPALYYRANVSALRGNSEDANKDLQKILILDPGNVRAYITKAQIAQNNDQDSQAIALIVNAIKTLPKEPALRLALANYQMSHGKFADALATLNGLLQVSPNNTDALALRGQIQIFTGAKREGVDTFRSLVAADPRSPTARIMLAKALDATQDNLAAEDAVKAAVELAPKSAQLRLSLVELQISHGQPDAALATARAYRSAFPGPQAELLFADTLIQLKRTNEAATVLTNGLISRPDRQLVMRLSELALASGDSRKAIAVLADWLAKYPDDFDVRLKYASTLLGSGNQEAARKEFEALLKQKPEDPTILNNLSWILQKDDPSRSLSLISLAARIAPRSADITDTLGWIKLQRQDREGALIALQRAHNLAANNAVISYHLAVALDATGKRAEAKTLLQSVLAKNPKFNGVEDAKQLVARW